jgi:hypothetical protein
MSEVAEQAVAYARELLLAGLIGKALWPDAGNCNQRLASNSQ